MNWLAYFLPVEVARFSSRYNRDIRLLRTNGKYKILVNGSPQSGAYIEKLWRTAFRAFRLQPAAVHKKILVLGVAGGTVIHLLREFYPQSLIVGVDIDALMINIGKKYFGLGKLNRLKLVRSEAQQFIAQAIKKKDRFDLIIVDLSFGQDIPGFVISLAFLQHLERLLPSGGELVINYLREKEYQERSNLLLDKLRQIYDAVLDKEIFLNRFFWMQKS